MLKDGKDSPNLGMGNSHTLGPGDIVGEITQFVETVYQVGVEREWFW